MNPNTLYQPTVEPLPQYTIELVTQWQSFLSMHGSKYMTNQSMHESKYMTNIPTWEGCWLLSFSVHPHDEDQEAPLLQKPWCINATASSRERWTRAYCFR